MLLNQKYLNVGKLEAIPFKPKIIQILLGILFTDDATFSSNGTFKILLDNILFTDDAIFSTNGTLY